MQELRRKRMLHALEGADVMLLMRYADLDGLLPLYMLFCGEDEGEIEGEDEEVDVDEVTDDRGIDCSSNESD